MYNFPVGTDLSLGKVGVVGVVLLLYLVGRCGYVRLVVKGDLDKSLMVLACVHYSYHARSIEVHSVPP